MIESPDQGPLPTLSQIFNHLREWYRDPITHQKLTIRQVSMRTPGVSQAMLESISSGREIKPGYDVLEAIADAFGIPMDVLFPRRWKRKQFVIPPGMEGFPLFPQPEAYVTTDEHSNPMAERG